MIALNEDRAFYGVPSDRISPGPYEDVKATLQLHSDSAAYEALMGRRKEHRR
jgi:hypothetical protein